MSTTSTQPYSSLQDPEAQHLHPSHSHSTTTTSRTYHATHQYDKNDTQEEATSLPLKAFGILAFILIGLVLGLGIANQYRLMDKSHADTPNYILPVGCPSNNYTDDSILCVQVLFSSHVDIGFNVQDGNNRYLAAQTLDHYFRTLFPHSVNASATLRLRNADLPVEEQKWYIYMTQWWLVSLYMDCPPNMGFYCPTDDEKAAFQTAIDQGDITWHALPFNLEAELFEPELMDYILQASKDLSAQYHRVGGAPNYVSQRDVPGTTRAVIPWFFKHGIKAMTFGANEGSAPIGEGNAYLWKDIQSNTSMYVLYHKAGYGGIEVKDAVILDGFNRVALFDWNGDNAGPYSIDEISMHFDNITTAFKNDPRFKGRQIAVVATSLDDYVNALDFVVKANLVSLPVKTFEMGDTWIHGTGSDPVKVAQFRALQRLWANCTRSSDCDSDSASFHNFTRLLLKGGEHTWGADVKFELNYTDPATWNNWSNENLTKALNTTNYQNLMTSWIEQRNWAIEIPLSALPQDHPIVTGAAIEFAALKPKAFNMTGYTKVDNFNNIFHVGRFQIGFNNMTGAINHLVNSFDSKTYASMSNELATLVYSTFTEKDFENFLNEYTYESYLDPNGWWVSYDFGKNGLDEHANTMHYTGSPTLEEMYYRAAVIINGSSDSIASWLLVLTYENSSLHTDFGAPAMQVIQIDLDSLNDVPCNITVTNYNKQYTRIPEALWVRFNPVPNSNSSWTVNKLGFDIDPSNIAINGSRHLHASSSRGVSLSGIVQIQSPDIFLVSLGEPNPFPTPLGGPSTNVTDGMNFCLFNNIWGTNYVEWYPFLEEEADQQYRFALNFF
jgi:hypothetical protein